MSYSSGRWAGGDRPVLPEQLDKSGVQMRTWPLVEHAIKAERPLLIMGDVGVGKTVIMACIEKGIRRLNPAPNFTPRTRAGWLDEPTWWSSVSGYLADVRQGWSLSRRYDDWGPHCDAKGIAMQVPRLFLDDLGTESIRDGNLDEVNELIDARYVKRLKTWLTTNLTVDQITDRYGRRTMSRLLDMCEMLFVHGEDRRTPRFASMD